MLIGCGCNCREGSVSEYFSGPSMVSVSQGVPSLSSFDNSTGAPVGLKCFACIADVSGYTYRVHIEGMQDQQPTIFGNWGCVEMLQTPYLLYPGAEQQYPFSDPNNLTIAVCQWMTVTQPPGPPVPPPYTTYNGAGIFYPKAVLANPVPGQVCGTAPKTFFGLLRYQDQQGNYTYQARLVLEMRGRYGVQQLPPGSPEPLDNRLFVWYKTPIFNDPLFCLNEFTLDWDYSQGTYERVNPNGPGFESWGFGPGNNVSYEFDRGDFPQFIRVRPE